MSGELNITLAPERLDEGSPEERAAFGMLTIQAAGLKLTEGIDSFISNYRPGPLVSGYHAAEWLAWNWWRLRFEPQSAAPEWWRAHRMPSIGQGYVWPNLSIFSDGYRTTLVSGPSSRPDAKPFRYTGSKPIVVRSEHFESAVDDFIGQIVGRLRDAKITSSNLDMIWRDLIDERSDPNRATRRRMEALLGRDPDEGSEAELERLISDSASVGEAAMEEMAADHAQGGTLFSADELSELAAREGFDSNPRDAVRLRSGAGLPLPRDVAAWRRGAEAARALRAQEGLDGKPIDNGLLAELAGVSPKAIDAISSSPSVSFALDENATRGRVVLRSRWQAGRRFEVARIVGDRLLALSAGRLYPATRAHTYRQKMQRSFAAELLSPFESVDDLLDGDYSPEKQLDVAEHFQVSELTIRTLLVNHGRIERDELEVEPEVVAT